MSSGVPPEGSESRNPAPRGHWGDLLRVAQRGQTYRNLIYLVAAFPLGLSYFMLLIVGFATGLGTAIIGVGLALLLAMLWVSAMLAAFERLLVRGLIRVVIPAPTGPQAPYFSRRQELIAFLRRPLTWKNVIYLLLEFPFGVVSFCLTTVLLSISLSLLVYPLITAITLTIGSHPGNSGGFQPDTLVRLIWQDLPLPWAPILDALLLMITPAVGAALLTVSLHALNGMAQGWGQFARVMLSESIAAQRLAEARARAARGEARAESADQRRRELIVNVSHELRTPIANIRGHVESLRPPLDDRLSEGDKQRYLAIVAREADRLSALVDDLLALARADADELHLEVRPIPVGLIVEEVYQSLAPLAQRDRQVTLVRTIAPDLPYALADSGRLAQVLLNLTRNAITATPVGGLVFLDLERADPRHLALTVSDTGHGIPEEDLERVFERFYRVDTARPRATGGFGLGLSIVRDLVQAMGGAVAATSTEGSGSCFRVLLRVVPAPE
ncbi:MAG TPA: sensor domain-containing protein [Chloroflexota bacterium]|nr:sensor domain-containing protein [Chloroflexota bacterium]